jgi:O-acetyl-ADP-ribose deacetylase (regulator of RNase III)
VTPAPAPPRWTVKSGDILDEPADVLVCSANVFLNLSGGVGGELLRRHGDALQRELHAELARRGVRHVARGDVIRTSGGGSHFRTILHAVGVDGFYETSQDVIRTLIAKALEMAAAAGATSVALAAVGTGYGRMTMRDFGAAIATLTSRPFAPIASVVVCVRHDDERAEIEGLLRSPDGPTTLEAAAAPGS